jgi:hypothetical protein
LRHPHATVLHHGQKPKASFTGRIYARNLTLDQKALGNREESIYALRDVGSPGAKACNDMRRAWVCSGWPDRISSFHGRVPKLSRDGLPTPGNKKAGTLSGIPAFLELLWSVKWWRWGESNPRPKARDLRYYMLSTTFVLGRRQHDVRSTPADTPALFKHRLAGRRQCLFRDDDPTSTSTDTSGFGAYALSGESVVVVVGN